MTSIIIMTIAIVAVVFIAFISGLQLLMKGATTREEQFLKRNAAAIEYNNSLRRK